jgi:hypothetical protein
MDGGKFRLTGDSAGVDDGTALSGFNTDMKGNPRGINGKWDIGPFEYQESTTPESPLPPSGLRIK